MSRSNWKGPYIENLLITTIYNDKKKKENQTNSRKTVITPVFIGKTVTIHNGKIFLKLKITDEMLGHKLGEFSPTRKTFTFKKKRRN